MTVLLCVMWTFLRITTSRKLSFSFRRND